MVRTAVAFIVLMVLASAAQAEKRVALVIGNGAYTKVPKLDNPKNDAAAMEAMLKAAGFDTVVRANDLGVAAMRRALRDFSDNTYNADIAVVFYAGHGMEVGGINYLIPTDAVLERDIDAQDEAVSLDRVGQILEPAKRLRLVILDACRDNPFVRSMRRTVATRAIRSGYGEIDERSLPPNTLVAYAQRAGATAEDGTGTNSPYTTALLKHLPTPGLDVELALRRVRDDVLKITRNRQEPFRYGSLGGAEIPLVAAPAAPPPAPTYSAAAEAVRICREVEGMSSLSMLGVLANQHKGTPAGDCIASRMDELKQAEAAKQLAAVAKNKADEEARAKADSEAQRLALLQKEEERKRDEAAKQLAAAAKKKADEEARAKAEAEAQHLALLQKEEERKRDEAAKQLAAAAKNKADEEARAKADSEAQRVALLQKEEERKRDEAAKQLAEAAKKKADEEARVKAEAAAQRLALLQREEERKRAEATKQLAEAAKKKADEEARAKAEAVAQRLALLQQKEEERKRTEADAAQKVAAATPPPMPKANPTSDPTVKGPAELALAIQTELKRVGCDPGPVNGSWGAKSRQALGEFARATKTAIPSEEPSDGALNALVQLKGRVCPLRCGAGETETGGRCVAKAGPEAPKADAAAAPAKSNQGAKQAKEESCWAMTQAPSIVPCDHYLANKKRKVPRND